MMTTFLFLELTNPLRTLTNGCRQVRCHLFFCHLRYLLEFGLPLLIRDFRGVTGLCVVRDYPLPGREYFSSRAIEPELILVIAEWDNTSNQGLSKIIFYNFNLSWWLYIRHWLKHNSSYKTKGIMHIVMSSVLNHSICEIGVFLEIEILRVFPFQECQGLFAICCLLKWNLEMVTNYSECLTQKLKYW